MHNKGIFGTYRYFLATMVVMSHLIPMDYSACGYYAVFGFFALSGYLITQVLHEHYLHIHHGIRRFFLNRFLRIFPLYWLVALVALGLIAWMPETSQNVHHFMTMPSHIGQWLANIFIIGIALPTGLRIDSIFIPPAWSLTTEVCFYLLLPCLVRNRFMWIWWICMALAFWASFIIENKSFHIRYFSILGGMMPFAVGSALYLWKDILPRIPHVIGLSIITLLVICYLASYAIFGEVVLLEGFIVVFILNLLTIHYLSRLTFSSTRWQKIDTILGNIAYPTFLVHLPVAVILKATIASTLLPKSLTFFLLSLPFVYLAAYALHVLVERPINRIRSTIRQKRNPNPI